MDEQRLTIYREKKNAVTAANAWNNLPNGTRYQGDKFDISVAHCKPPKLCRAGQQSCGGRNYWETEEAFNNTILEYIVENWESIYPDVRQRMKDKEAKALQACQSFIDDMQSRIDGVDETALKNET